MTQFEYLKFIYYFDKANDWKLKSVRFFLTNFKIDYSQQFLVEWFHPILVFT